MKVLPTVLVLAAAGVFFWVSSKKPPATDAPKTPVEAAQVQSQGATTHGEPPAVEIVKPADAPAPKPLPRNPNSIVGTVRDRAGDGVPQIVVQLLGPDGQERAKQRTDGQGRFAFEGVAAGSYKLATWDPDYLYTSAAQVAATAKKDGVTEADLTVDRGTAAIRGVAVDSRDKPIADLRVAVTAGGREFSVSTDAKGRFGVSGLMPGEWKVTAPETGTPATTVRLEDRKVADVRLLLQQAGSIEVTLTGSPLHPAELFGTEKALLRKQGSDAIQEKPLTAVHEKGDRHHVAQTYGVASFGGLPAGDYELEIVDAGGKSLIHLKPTWDGAVPVTLKEGEERAVVYPTILASYGQGAHVPTWIVVVMFVGIGLMVFVTPILFPPPLVPKAPPMLPKAPPLVPKAPPLVPKAPPSLPGPPPAKASAAH